MIPDAGNDQWYRAASLEIDAATTLEQTSAIHNEIGISTERTEHQRRWLP